MNKSGTTRKYMGYLFSCRVNSSGIVVTCDIQYPWNQFINWLTRYCPHWEIQLKITYYDNFMTAFSLYEFCCWLYFYPWDQYHVWFVAAQYHKGARRGERVVSILN